MTPPEEIEKLAEMKRFEKFVVPEPNTGCHLWIGGYVGTKPHMYGVFTVKHKPIKAHSYIYEHFYGKIPPKLVIDHKCRVTYCVNPKHLRAVTQRINSIENSVGSSAKNFVKTHCNNGHKFTTYNTNYTDRNGYIKRNCRTCMKKLKRAWYEKYEQRKKS